jgi:hypothetical protein
MGYRAVRMCLERPDVFIRSSARSCAPPRSVRCR